jgi:hypothetical protein
MLLITNDHNLCSLIIAILCEIPIDIHVKLTTKIMNLFVGVLGWHNDKILNIIFCQLNLVGTHI